MSDRPARLDSLIDVLDSSGDATTRTALRMLDGSDGPARSVFTPVASDVVLPGGHAGSPSPALVSGRSHLRSRSACSAWSPGFRRANLAIFDARLNASINVL
jgi:hypothetical protein